MLVSNLRPKVVSHRASHLLLDLMVRARGRLVVGAPPSGPSEARPCSPIGKSLPW
jgi:hypothetical protein